MTPHTLPTRLRAAREAVGLTQEQAAEAVGLSRSALSLVESGQRKVTSTELYTLARLYGRRLDHFFAEEFDPEETLLLAFRTVGAAELPAETQREVLHLCQEVAHALRSLESLLGISRPLRGVASAGVPALWNLVEAPEQRQARAWLDQFPAPRNLWEALEQGEEAAIVERRRLGLGVDPVPDLVDLLEKEGVFTAALELPADVDGLTLNFPDLGPFVVVNRQDRNLPRRRFSYAHEYAHVLLDSTQRARVTHRRNQNDLQEKRANRFAAAFLMPARGVKEFLASLGKRPRENSSVVMEGETVYSVRNAAPASDSDIQPHDVVQLSHYFGVGHQAVLYRLESLKYLSLADRDRLWQAEQEGKLRELWRVFMDQGHAAPSQDEPDRFQRRFLTLTLEALRRDEISTGRARELFRLVGLDEERFADAVRAEGMQDRL